MLALAFILSLLVRMLIAPLMTRFSLSSSSASSRIAICTSHGTMFERLPHSDMRPTVQFPSFVSSAVLTASGAQPSPQPGCSTSSTCGRVRTRHAV